MHVRKIAAGVAAALAMSTGTVAFTATPAAARPGCVTDAEWRKASRGMAVDRVHNIFDTVGRISSESVSNGNRDVYREYRACNKPNRTFMTVNFDNYSSNKSGMRLYGKSFYRY